MPLPFPGILDPGLSELLGELRIAMETALSIPYVTFGPTQRTFGQGDRPSQDPTVPSISLLYDGFGVFADVLQGLPVPGEENILEMDLWNEVEVFMGKMAGCLR